MIATYMFMYVVFYVYFAILKNNDIALHRVFVFFLLLFAMHEYKIWKHSS
jgi:hypothetical protein